MGRTCALALTALIALAALPCPAAVQFVQLDDNGAEWMTALGVANSAVSYWNARRLEQSAVDLRGLLAASKSVDVEDHYHLTMDVSGRNTGTLMMEAYKEDGNWVFLVSSAIKNAKATFPETRTSENDAWRRVSPSETKVAEAVKEAR
ncbi:hypothetical protein T484DRAFT_1808011 [Baffinella frigidus]|nr:hypothetical protein T484DRAFT_1808011 [Cryptophyta sp. CCMP2293]